MDLTLNLSEQMLAEYTRMEAAIAYLEEHFQEQPDLAAAAAAAGLSEFHFQRLFTRWVGISPKRFLQYLTKEHAKSLLRKPADLLEAAYDSGLSGPGRLHDLFVAAEAVTPGEYKARGAGLSIRYGFQATPFGECLVGLTSRGLCHLGFVQSGREDALAELRSAWLKAELVPDQAAASEVVRRIFWERGPEALPVLLNGTNFQIKVWEALLRIPTGSLVSYEDMAVAVGLPGGAQAVGQALGRNPLAVIIPCHRVIRKDGDYGQYRYGSARKKALLAWEFGRAEATAQ